MHDVHQSSNLLGTRVKTQTTNRKGGWSSPSKAFREQGQLSPQIGDESFTPVVSWFVGGFGDQPGFGGGSAIRVPTAPGKPGKTGPDLENLEKQEVLGQKPGKILQNLEKKI